LSLLYHIVASTRGQGMASFTHVHCAHAAIIEEEDTTVYLEQGSATFNALAEVCHTAQVEVYQGYLPQESALLCRYAVVTTRGLLR